MEHLAKITAHDIAQVSLLLTLSRSCIYLYKGRNNNNKFKKNCKLTSYTKIFGQRTFFFIVKLVFREKCEFYLFCDNTILKDCVLFKQTQLSIEIDIIVVKKHIFLNFVEKYVRSKRKKESLSYYNYHY